MNYGTTTRDDIQEVLDYQCLKESLHPPDVARFILFLASDDSRMCTSQEYVDRRGLDLVGLKSVGLSVGAAYVRPKGQPPVQRQRKEKECP